ncbi:MAG: hypothetical protein Q4B48_08590 [Syntrophomonadaceae bacterium]|nr:hypothetical protein [Syntrophomonadaceae bacterium]
MSWISIAAIVLGALLVLGFILKIRLRRKLEDIDGFHGIHKRSEGNVIGCAGDDATHYTRESNTAATPRNLYGNQKGNNGDED